MHVKGKKLGVFVTSFIILSALIVAWWTWQPSPGYIIEPGFLTVEKAYLNQQSGMMVEVTGEVVRVLRENRDNQRQQQFVVRLRNGQNLLVSHAITASGMVQAGVGDEVIARGEYRWTETGGSIQWTHRDDSSRRRHGWIEHKGKRYD